MEREGRMAASDDRVVLGLIGTGFMGKAHALAWRAARAVMGPELPEVRLKTLCDPDGARAAHLARSWGFAGWVTDWRRIIDDPEIDCVAITTPNALHRDMALAAIGAGKAVHCEKPLAPTLADAAEMAAAAAEAGVPTQVGYNYLHNPAFRHAERLVAEGAIGRVVHFRGVVAEDYLADGAAPWSWRLSAASAGLGVLGDLGCHLVAMALALCGPVARLVGDTRIVHPRRPRPDGTGEATVENEDTATALLRFVSGAHGSLTASRIAWGRKNRLAWELTGTEGTILFDQERMNELRLFRRGRHAGFETVLTGPEHPPYGAFCPAPGHQLGFNDLKVIEVAGFLRHLAGGPPGRPDFAEALAYERVIHAIDRSARSGGWVVLGEEDG